jgi:digeranylgeranylglycerophospholipid reductase
LKLEKTNVILVSADVIVVGAGPAGSFSALQAAKLGAQVIICEEHNKVGVSSHCTGHISLAGIKRFSLKLPKSVFENKIKSAIFYSPSGYRFSVRFSSPVTCVVNRELLDQHLSNMALKAGVKILNNTYVKSFLIERDAVRGVIIKGKKMPQKLISKVVIDAEGVSSSLLKRAGLPSLNRRMVINGVQAEVDRIDNIDNDTVEVFLSHRFASGFFAWIVPRSDGTAKVGLGTEKGNPRECLRHFISHNQIARQRLKRSHVTNLVYHPISLGGPISRTFYDGLLIVGDAASHVKPTTGGGIIMGLTCAKIAGKVAAYAVRYRDSSLNFLSEYERRWKKKIGFDMMAMKLLRLMLNGFSDKQLDQFIALCTRLRLDESLKNVKDIDFQGTSLIRMAKSPRVLATALYFLKASFL